MAPKRQRQVIFQRPYVRLFLLSDLACFSFRSAAAAILVREPLQKASKPYKCSGQADIDAGQVESCNENRQVLLCTACAVSAVHERAMAGQGRSPCGLGESKGGHSSAKNGPLSRCQRRRINDIAAAMKIPPEDFRWYAAFHDEGNHPHVHMMAWSVKPNQAYLSKDGIRQIKSTLTNQIFRQELLHVYEQKSKSRDELVAEARKAMQERNVCVRRCPNRRSSDRSRMRPSRKRSISA